MKKLIMVLCGILALALVAGCATSSTRLDPRYERGDEKGITGTYSVILFGNQFTEDLETVAILDKEGDPYTIEPYAPGFRYRVQQHVPAQEALAMARHFLSAQTRYGWYWLSVIPGPGGEVVGYEMKPRHLQTYYSSDPIDVDYFLKGDRITVYVRLKPEVDRAMRTSSDKDRD